MIKITNSIVALLLFGLPLSPVMATTFTLTNGNSEAIVDSMSQDGMKSWTVDGTNYLQQQWFWLRTDTLPLTSIDTLTLAPESHAPNSNTLELRYGAADTFWLDIFYELLGGPTGSGTATIKETLKITNNNSSSSNFRLFQYSDFDLSIDNDLVEITGGDTATQKAAGLILTETMSTITPSTIRVEANTAPNTKNSLNAGTDYQLNLTDTSGPGNVTWAFQWDRILGPGTTFEITKTKTISAASTNPIPEPSTLLLFGTGLLMAGLARKTCRR